MRQRKITSYRLIRDGVINSATYNRLRNGQGVSMDTLAALCEALNCQPGDILEYVE
ncbi:MAG: helix-turn-helix transcriptional regulator [Coriobacteriales bacterium]|nr:helix-turn-helix transcriptional regulator [Coriobacteriales bacterium]